jgi:hypothetical protein
MLVSTLTAAGGRRVVNHLLVTGSTFATADLKLSLTARDVG